MDDLYLPGTKISLSDGVIRKYASDGSLMASFDLEDVREIRCVRTAEDSFSLVLVAIFTALGFVAREFITSAGIAWTVAVLCWGLALFCIVLIYGRKLVLETEEGTVGYPVADGPDEAEGFVMSVKHEMRRMAAGSSDGHD